MKRIICLLLSMILLSGVSLLSGCSNEKKEVEQEFLPYLEQAIDEVKSEYSYIEDITYEYTLEKGNYRYYAYVVFQIEASVDYEKNVDAVFGVGDMFSIKLDLFVHEYLENAKVIVESYGDIFVNGKEAAHQDKSSIKSSNSGSKTCSICGKSYSSGGTSNMCSQCYKNYKYAADAAGY